MRIEAELDPVHGERLRALQARMNKPLAEVLAIAIDAVFDAGSSMPAEGPAPLYTALEAIGFVGCIEDDERLATHYKQQLDFAGDVADGVADDGAYKGRPGR